MLIVPPLVIAVLALISAVIFFRKGGIEYVFPRVVICLVYWHILTIPEMLEETRVFLVRWSLTLVLAIEILSSITRWILLTRYPNLCKPSSQKNPIS